MRVLYKGLKRMELPLKAGDRRANRLRVNRKNYRRRSGRAPKKAVVPEAVFRTERSIHPEHEAVFLMLAAVLSNDPKRLSAAVRRLGSYRKNVAFSKRRIHEGHAFVKIVYRQDTKTSVFCGPVDSLIGKKADDESPRLLPPRRRTRKCRRILRSVPAVPVVKPKRGMYECDIQELHKPFFCDLFRAILEKRTEDVTALITAKVKEGWSIYHPSPKRYPHKISVCTPIGNSRFQGTDDYMWEFLKQ